MEFHVDKYERYWLNMVIVVLAIFFASLVAGIAIFGVRPPVAAGFINPLEIDESEFANPGVRHMGGNRYEAYIIAQKWNFVPSQITIPEGAELTINITSRDVTHGFMIEHKNANIEVIPGHIGRVRVTFDKAGEYHYLCHEFCGQLHHAMWGKITVEEASAVTAKE